MIRKIDKIIPRLTTVALLVLCSACGSGSNSGGDISSQMANNTPIISNDATIGAVSAGVRELVVSETTEVKTVTQCFCTVRFRSTLQFYHFSDKNAVLMIEFDNQSREFVRTADLVLFDVNATTDGIEKWINNQHSDGLFFDFAKPLDTYAISSDAIAITSAAFVENLSGDSGDRYEHTLIDFTVANLSEPNRYFLNGFADQSVVYLQTQQTQP